MGKKNLTRRTFVVGGAALVAGIGVGAVAKPCAAQANVLRPPGAVSEADFMALCIKCSRCISACPTDVLKPLGMEDGMLQARTPTLSYLAGSCTFCDECRIVCPTGAVGEVDPFAPETGRIGGAILHEDRCLAFLQSGSCGVCVDACPYEALSFDEGRKLVVDQEKCNGCGECVRVCPANVLTSFSGGEVRGIEVVTDKTLSEMGGQR